MSHVFNINCFINYVSTKKTGYVTGFILLNIYFFYKLGNKYINKIQIQICDKDFFNNYLIITSTEGLKLLGELSPELTQVSRKFQFNQLSIGDYRSLN